jgi:4-diphosphocytidyl-2-C-methyl-D-erythritol kinase
MKIKSYARITLSLAIIGKLDSGYHEVETIKNKIGLYDSITIKESNETTVKCDKLKDTIVTKAIHSLKEKYGIKKNVEVDIQKNIPIGGGLAGGSSNGAAVILALNKLWNINAPVEILVPVARITGTDLPCFLYDGLVYDHEPGEEIKIIGTLPKMSLVMINTGLEILSKDAYTWIDYEKIGKTLAVQKIIQNKADLIKHMHNDFEQFIFPRFPVLKNIRDNLEIYGLKAILSGTGSTVYGLAPNKKLAKQAYANLKDKYKSVILTDTI